MQNSINLGTMQVRPATANVSEGLEALKCAIGREVARLWATKSETFSYLCEEDVTYGDVVKTMVGTAALFALVAVSGFIAGGEVM
nr:hypothetical protein [uncultured Prevotella sp.]